mgnify:CR=1 FL=1
MVTLTINGKTVCVPEGTSILDFIRYAVAFLLTKQQYYEWRLDT